MSISVKRSISNEFVIIHECTLVINSLLFTQYNCFPQEDEVETEDTDESSVDHLSLDGSLGKPNYSFLLKQFLQLLITAMLTVNY